jgi:hypothetical protein
LADKAARKDIAAVMVDSSASALGRMSVLIWQRPLFHVAVRRRGVWWDVSLHVSWRV